jgi:hypothetical protein
MEAGRGPEEGDMTGDAAFADYDGGNGDAKRRLLSIASTLDQGLEDLQKWQEERTRKMIEGKIPHEVLVLENLLPVSAANLITQELPDLTPLVEGLIYPGNVLVIGGLVKARKTWLALQLSLACISGNPFLEHEAPEKLRVLYLGAEGSDRTIRKRLLLAVNHFPDLKDEDMERLGIVSTLGRVKLDTPGGEEWLQRVSEGYDIIVIDPYYRFLSRGSENLHEDQRVIQDVLDRLKARDKGIVLVHHLRKPQGVDIGPGELRGAGLDGYADSILLLSRKKTGTGDRFTLKYILRHDEEPDDLNLGPNGPLLQIVDEESIVKTADVVRAIREAGGRIDGRKTVEDILMGMTEAGRDTCKKAIQKAGADGHIFSAKREGRGQGRTYILGEERISGNED